MCDQNLSYPVLYHHIFLHLLDRIHACIFDFRSNFGKKEPDEPDILDFSLYFFFGSCATRPFLSKHKLYN